MAGPTLSLTEAERAYRRGALQAVEFILAGLPYDRQLQYLARWREALVAGRDSTDPAYLGRYLDTVKERLL